MAKKKHGPKSKLGNETNGKDIKRSKNQPFRWKDRIHLGPPILILLGLSMFWTISMFVAPMVLEPGTVRGLDGTSDRVNYADKWAKLDPYTASVYTFGDSQCHQKETRSFIIHGNQMPVCARVFSIFFFANIGMFIAMLVRPDEKVSKMVLFFLPQRFREKHENGMVLPALLILFIILMSLPVAFDGFYQLLTPYESTNIKRVLTGMPMGLMGGLVVGALMVNIWIGVKDTRSISPKKHVQ